MRFVAGLMQRLFRRTPEPLEPEEFLEQFAERLRRAAPALRVGIRGPMELSLTLADGREARINAENAYALYLKDPRSLRSVVDRFAKLTSELPGKDAAPLAEDRIVAVIKPPAFFEQLPSDEARSLQLYDTLLEDELLICFAVDTEEGMHYLNREHAQGLSFPREELLERARKNLRRILKEVVVAGGPDVFAVQADGNYEPSLILLRSFWQSMQGELKGFPVFAIPARGVLLVTGSDNSDGVLALRQAAKDLHARAPHPISPRLFARREDALSVYMT